MICRVHVLREPYIFDNGKDKDMRVDLKEFTRHCSFAAGELEQDLWEYLKSQTRPIWLYGMGDGALKVMDAMAQHGLKAEGVFASDNFARDKIFCGYQIHKYSDVKTMYQPKGFIILLCFAAFRDDLYPVILDISAQQELYAPDVPVVYDGGRVFTLNYVKEHETQLMQVYDMLADEQSRQVFRDVLCYKCTGKVEYLDRCTTDMDEVYENLIQPQNSDVYVDLGAYNGDTVTEFLTHLGGNCSKVIALEPDARNYKKLCAQVELLQEQYDKTEFMSVHAGAHSHEDVMQFAATTGRSGKLNALDKPKKTVDVRVCAVDDLLAGQRADVIKLDVEGAEREALMGCEKTIVTYRPRLMVSAYHRNEDLFALPLQIQAMQPSYKVYLRHHRYIPAWETCYYFV